MFRLYEYNRESVEMKESELYLNEIKNKLRAGHASVLVGSGFSRNAIRKDGSDKKMPEWSDLADLFCEKLGIDPEDKNNRYTNPLSLAQQVIEVYNRPYMNDLLKTTMDDDAYIPGKVHNLLISLPWSDIFTTNYDTLLERAYQDSIRMGTVRGYRVIYNKNDLLYSAGMPRIIKLHGSFPSYEPFIISEEDYRRYPMDFAPFVNTVQQSLLENVLVLIGFSGKDPNFLNWIGWIHDNLGVKNSPRMYLVVHKSVSDVQKKMLASKNIDVIVLDDFRTCSNKDYSAAMEQFLSDIYDNIRIKNSKKTWPQYNSLIYDSKPLKVLEYLKNNRNSYPGWTIAKYNCLELSRIQISHIEIIIRKLADNKKPNQSDCSLELEICKEFCWFCEITGTIISTHTVEALRIILNRHRDTEDSEIILRIELFILRYYRYIGEAGWEELYFGIKDRLVRNDGWNELYTILSYEYAMQMIYSFKWEYLEDAIRMIPSDTEHGEWIIRKSGLLSMIGQYKEALALLKEGISWTRRLLLRGDKDNKDIYNRFLSMENCMTSLYLYIHKSFEMANGEIAHNSNTDYNEEDDGIRNSADDVYKSVDREDFIWNIENEKRVSVISGIYKPMISVTQTHTFDIGRISESRHIGGDYELIKAFQFIIFREVTGQPFRIGNITNKEGLLGAVSRIGWQSHRMAIALAIISGDNKILEATLTRLSLADMREEEVAGLCTELINLMYYCIRYNTIRDKKSSFDLVLQDYAVELIPEAISRLLTKCCDKRDIFKKAIELLKVIYNDEVVSNINGIKNLLKRCIDCMNYNIFENLLSEFWGFEIKSDDTHMDMLYPDPFYFVSLKVDKYEKNKFYKMEQTYHYLFNEWLKKTNDERYQKNALSRLMYIYSIYNLPDKLVDELREALWNKDNLDEYNLPNLGPYLKTSVIYFPHDQDDQELLSRVSRYICDEYDRYISKEVMTDFRNLFQVTFDLIDKYEFDEKKTEKALNIALRFCRVVVKCSNPSVSYGFFNGKGTLAKVDEIVGTLLFKAHMVLENKAVDNDNVKEIIKILEDSQCPHALLTWCTTEGSYAQRYKIINSYILNEDIYYINNAIQTLYRLIEEEIEFDRQTIELMVHSIATTQAYNVNYYVIGVEYLIRNNLLNDDAMKLIADALPKLDKISRIDVRDDDEDVMRKLATRKTVSHLAYTMYNQYIENDKSIPAGVLQWEEIAKDIEEFAEIRLVWDKVK